MITNNSGINVDDFVVVKDYGYLYSSYAEAMKQLWGKEYHGFDKEEEQYPNGLMGRTDSYFWGDKYWRNKKWRVASMAMHENGKDVLCQLIDRLKRSILVGAYGLEVIKHNPKKVTKTIPKIKAIRNRNNV